MPADVVVGVVGAGWAAREHCESLARLGGTGVAGVYDVDSGAAQRLAADYGGRVVATVEDVLSMPDVNALIVATPSGAHRAAVVPAMERGVAVFVEKPLSRVVSDALAIAEAADRTQAVCAVGYQWRAVDSLPELQSAMAGTRIALMISQGLGVTQARSWFGDPRLSGGLVFERVSHHIDLQRMIAGEVTSVSAVHGEVPLSGVSGYSERCEDVISLVLSFASGAVGAVHVAWTPAEHPPTQALRILTTGDVFDLDLDPLFEVRRQGSAAPFASSGHHPFRRQLACFLHAVRTGDPGAVSCSARDAAGTVVVATAAERALSGQGPQFCAGVLATGASPTGGGRS